MRYFILIFKSYELICCRTCFRGLAPGASEELCCHFSSRRKPLFISGAPKTSGQQSVTKSWPWWGEWQWMLPHTSNVSGTEPASTGLLVSCARWSARADMGKLSVGCNRERRELKEVGKCFITLTHEGFVWWATVSISYCSGIPVRHQIS